MVDSLRVLLVEAEAGRGQSWTHMLAEANEVLIVPTAEAALEALSIQRFDAVLLEEPVMPNEQLLHLTTTIRDHRGRIDELVMLLVTDSEVPGAASVDGRLKPDFTNEDLQQAVSLARQQSGAGTGEAERNPVELLDFDPIGFSDQCANEDSLMIEIIDLFSEECRVEVPAMAEALGSGNFDQLSRLAHKLKGSLGSLQAPQSRRTTHDLELAAKSDDADSCARLLEHLEGDLEGLREKLAGFRETCLQRPAE